jgi:hypothetical protein
MASDGGAKYDSAEIVQGRVDLSGQAIKDRLEYSHP